VIKGWSSNQKDARDLAFQHPTIQPLGPNKNGLDIIGNIGYFRVGTDTIDSMGPDAFTITAAAHVARPGDVIRFTSGNAIYIQSGVLSVTTNTIVLGDTFKWSLTSYLPAAGDTFLILRPRIVEIDEVTGSIVTAPISTGPVQFTRNGATQTVIEDTTTIVNNRALPIKTINDVSETIINDYGTTPVTTGAWVQVLAATANKTVKANIFDSSGCLIELGTGAAASEVRKLLITPGGPGMIEVQIPAATRLSVRAVNTSVSGNATSGFLAINLIRE